MNDLMGIECQAARENDRLTPFHATWSSWELYKMSDCPHCQPPELPPLGIPAPWGLSDDKSSLALLPKTLLFSITTADCWLFPFYVFFFLAVVMKT